MIATPLASPMPPIRRLVTCILSWLLAACAGHAMPVRDMQAPVIPAWVLGQFVDDYGIRYAISTTKWHQRPNARYRIVQWHAGQQYLIARNEATNGSDAGLWTRIDWMVLPGMPPWEWAFCLSAYEAATAAEAEATDIARREAPLVGCNGHPFSRMKRGSPSH